MRGMEFETLLAIILLVVVLALLASYFMPGLFAIGPATTADVNFRFYCDLWAAQGYKGTKVERKHDPAVDMNAPCTRALGLDCGSDKCMTSDDWPKCIAACKVATVED